MASEVEICNFALQEVGSGSIISLDDDNAKGKECKRAYENCRKTLLALHYWNFAVQRIILAPLLSTPPFGYKYEFLLPVDTIMPIGTEQEVEGFRLFNFAPQYIQSIIGASQLREDIRIEGGKILSNDNVLNFVYISDVENTTLFTQHFTELLILLIASKINFRLGSNKERTVELSTKFETMLIELRRLASQGQRRQYIDNSSLIMHRFN